MKFPKGTTMYWKHNNQPAYQKLGDSELDWWVSLDSHYVTNPDEVRDKGKDPIVKPESEKPLYRNGKLNRFGFQWTDKQVWEYYSPVVNFYFSLD